MNDYISKQKVLDYLNGYLHSLGEDADTLFNRGQRRALTNSIQDILAVKAAEVQPLSVVAEHIKNRLYETAFNTDELIASLAIEDVANRIDFWINELKDGDTE